MIDGLGLLSGLSDRRSIERLHDIPLPNNASGLGTLGASALQSSFATLRLDLVPDGRRIRGRFKKMPYLPTRKVQDIVDIPTLELREKRPDYESESSGGVLEIFGKPSTRD